jgi:hypothetical protein
MTGFAQHLAGGAAALRQAGDKLGHRVLAVGARVLEVGAGRKRPSRLVAGQYRDPDLVIGHHLLATLRDLLVEIFAPAVARLGPAQGQPADMVALFIEHRHCPLP